MIQVSYTSKMLPIILAIDTSCDDTSVAVTCGLEIWSNIVASQAEIHRPYGGVFPTVAKQAHQENIEATTQLSLKRARVKLSDVDIIAVTIGPGLAPSLEVGIEFATQLALKLNIPLQPANHIEGHIWSVLALSRPKGQWLGVTRERARASEHTRQHWKLVSLPSLAVIASGKHTQFVLIDRNSDYSNQRLKASLTKSTLTKPVNHGQHYSWQFIDSVTSNQPKSNQAKHKDPILQYDRQPRLSLAPNQSDQGQPWLTNGLFQYTVLGQTLDDAAGEAIDKIGRLVNLGYPAGPVVEQLALTGNNQAYQFPLPMTQVNSFDLSYSGIKTHARRLVQSKWNSEIPTRQEIQDFCASAQKAIFDHLLYKLMKIMESHSEITEIWLGGGVAANSYLRKLIRQIVKKQSPLFPNPNSSHVTFRTPSNKRLCQDNAGMIGVIIATYS